MNILITICARGGSKGIPGKNLKNINGYPLLAYSIQTAKEFWKKYKADFAFSTDDLMILEIANKLGFSTDYIRPSELATDNAGKIDTIKDLLLHEEKLSGKKYDYIIDLDITSPLRTAEDIITGFDYILKDKNALNLFSVSKPHRSPYFNQVEKNSNGYYVLVKQPNEPILTRQSAPQIWDLNASFYIYRRIFFDLGFRNAYTENSLIYIMPHICFDLDEPIDYEFMEYLIVNNKLDFTLDIFKDK